MAAVETEAQWSLVTYVSTETPLEFQPQRARILLVLLSDVSQKLEIFVTQCGVPYHSASKWQTKNSSVVHLVSQHTVYQ